MQTPPADKDMAAASTGDASRVDSSLAAKRLREEDSDIASSTDSRRGSKKRRQNDEIFKDPPTERELISGHDMQGEAGTVADATVKDGEEPEDGAAESDDFVFDDSEPSDQGRPDIIELDRKEIKEELSSGSSILVLEETSNWRSYCRAQFCIPQLIRGRPNIECDYRFNLKDRTGQRKGAEAWYPQPNRFYHISCIEHLFDLREILEQGWIKMEGGISLVGIFGNAVRVERFPTLIEEWFENKGSVYTVDEYKAYAEACEIRDRERSTRWLTHSKKVRDDKEHEGHCSCDWDIPEIKRSDYFPEERTPRLLSQVLASLAKVSQIDHLTDELLDVLKDMDAEEGTEFLDLLVKASEEKKEKRAALETPDSKVSGVDPATAAEATAAPPE